MDDPINIQAKPIPALPAGFKVANRQLFFRHRWKILLPFLAGVVVAGVVYILKPPMYESEAMLLIRYVPYGTSTCRADLRITFPGRSCENILDTQMEIISSYDFAVQVAEAIGPEKILAKLGGGTEKAAAALAIKRNLSVRIARPGTKPCDDVPPEKSNLLAVRFRHPDPAMAQSVVGHLVEIYMKCHARLLQDRADLDETFSKKADQLRSQLSQTEDELKKLESGAQVISNRVVDYEAAIIQLTRKRDMLEADYRDYAATLEQRRIEQLIGPSTGITKVQEPSPPRRNMKETVISMGIAPLSGLIAGLAWAFLSERAARQGD